MSNVAANCLSLQSILVCSHFAFCSDALVVASVVYFFLYYFRRDFNFEGKGGKKTISEDLCKEATLCKNIFTSPTHTFLSV